jgi:hypothetical protein
MARTVHRPSRVTIVATTGSSIPTASARDPGSRSARPRAHLGEQLRPSTSGPALLPDGSHVSRSGGPPQRSSRVISTGDPSPAPLGDAAATRTLGPRAAHGPDTRPRSKPCRHRRGSPEAAARATASLPGRVCTKSTIPATRCMRGRVDLGLSVNLEPGGSHEGSRHLMFDLPVGCASSVNLVNLPAGPGRARADGPDCNRSLQALEGNPRGRLRGSRGSPTPRNLFSV